MPMPPFVLAGVALVRGLNSPCADEHFVVGRGRAELHIETAADEDE